MDLAPSPTEPMAPTHQCDFCGRAFRTITSAPHKRFCTPACRNQWHVEHRRKAMQAYATTSGAEPQTDSTES